MLLRQKGFLPVTTHMLGIFIPSIFIVYGIKALAPRFVQSIQGQDIELIVFKFVQLLLGFLLYWLLPFFWGILISSLFPYIRLTKRGLLQVFFGGLIQIGITWDEIDGLLLLPRNYVAIRINRSGLPIFNGLFFNAIVGRLVRSDMPAILIAPGLEKREMVLNEIQKRDERN